VASSSLLVAPKFALPTSPVTVSSSYTPCYQRLRSRSSCWWVSGRCRPDKRVRYSIKSGLAGIHGLLASRISLATRWILENIISVVVPFKKGKVLTRRENVHALKKNLSSLVKSSLRSAQPFFFLQHAPLRESSTGASIGRSRRIESKANKLWT
jgi:hypothetical protein